MKMKDFYLTLLSDSSLNMFPDNKQSEFTVISKRKDGKWLWLKLQHHQKFLISQKKNNFFFLTFLDQRILNRIGMENITETCSNAITCEKYKLFIPTGNYVSPEYLAEEM